ncbi:MAG: nucleoside phosphorylase [Flavobacteriales bacterium]|nr:nucleoside phosphorylase [Flavobacteriales bacterium]
MKIQTSTSRRKYAASELPINADGRVYHLNLLSQELADTVILVGDPGRVAQVARHFGHIKVKRQNREFHTVTGTFRGSDMTVLSSGIGTDNMDIVVNELDALVNIDMERRRDREKRQSLRLLRLGTCGALDADIPLLSVVGSRYAIGLEGLIYYYQHAFTKDEKELQKLIVKDLRVHEDMPEPYVVGADSEFLTSVASSSLMGITITASGFYGPQGRELRLRRSDDLVARVAGQNYMGHQVLNFEMETSALYALGGSMGHRCATLCTVVANRITQSFANDYHDAVDNMIEGALYSLVKGK